MPQNASVDFQWKWCIMPLYRKYSLRKQSYYGCMELWSAFGVTGNQPFNFIDAGKVLGKNSSGILKAMSSAGITCRVNGENRTRFQYKKDGPTVWVFSYRFCQHMNTDDGKEELEIAMAFNRKQREMQLVHEEVTGTCA